MQKEKVWCKSLCWSSDSILWEVFCAKGKNIVQKSVLEFGTHSLRSVLCKSVKKGDSKGSSVM